MEPIINTPKYPSKFYLLSPKPPTGQVYREDKDVNLWTSMFPQKFKYKILAYW
jgi:hypothetical protein